MDSLPGLGVSSSVPVLLTKLDDVETLALQFATLPVAWGRIKGVWIVFFLNFVMFFFAGLFNFVVFFFCSSGTVLNLWSREKLSQDLQCATLDSPRSYKATNVSDAKMPFGYCFFAQRPVAHFFLGISGWVGVCWVRRRWIVTTFLSVLILSE